jgi:hypothetical protein
LPTSTDRRRRALLCTALAALAGLLSGCSEAQVARTTPVASATPIVLATLPPIGFNHRYGNNPVAAADAFALERKLFSQKEYWEVGLRADPAAAGFVDESDPNATAAARGRFSTIFVILASESLPTLRALLAGGDAGQQQYCQQLVDGLRTQGYTGLQNVTMAVFFGENDRHADLTWSRGGGYTFKILDNNLNGALQTPIPTATPFATPPPH